MRVFGFSAFKWRLLPLLGICSFGSAQAHAETTPRAPDTFEYQKPTEKNYLRAVLELEALTTVSVVWYVIDVRHGSDVDYHWPVFERKLAGSALGHDDNGFGTNFRGHALGGSAYYLSARGNHLSIAESFGFAVAGATLWEYFGEIGEVVSVNDLIFTPFSGIGLGEPLTQLGTFFDRQSPTLLHRVLGSLFGPIQSINAALDGQKLRRISGPDDEWHRFVFAVAPTFTRRDVRAPDRFREETADVRLEISERLARLRNYDGPSEHAEWFDDGNLSGMALRAAFRAHAVSDFALETNLVPFGIFRRSARRTPRGLYGGGFVLGYSMGYHYLVHDYGGPAGHSLDRAAFVQPLGAMFESRVALGSLMIHSRVDASAIYGGVHPMASDTLGAGRAALAPVLRNFNYYFGAGAQLEAQVGLRWAALEADGSLLGRSFTCVDEHVAQSIHDTWQRVALGVGVRARPALLLRLFADDTVRAGALADARGKAHESAAGFEVSAVF